MRPRRLSLNGVKAQQEPRYTTQRMTHPNEPTKDEAKVLKLMQPPGRHVNAQVVAANLNANLTTAQHWLSELHRKRYVSEHIRRGGFRRPPGPPTYSITDEGIKYLVEHGLTD